MPFFGGGGGDYHIVATNIKGGTSAAPAVIGSNNMALGNGALQNALLADDNIAIGTLALNTLTTGIANTAIGSDALWQLTPTNNGNAFIGKGKTLTDPINPAPAKGEQIANISSCVSIGDYTFATTGNRVDTGHSIDNSVGVGNGALTINSVPGIAVSNAICIGSSAGAFSVATSNVICIGQGANGASNSIAIGTAANALTNSIVIGDASHTSVVIGGVTLSSATGAVFSSAIVGDAGTEGTGITIGGVTYDSLFKVSDISSADIAQSIIHRHSTTWEPIQVFARSNSNGAGHGAVTVGMLISSQYAAGWTGTEYNLFGRTGFESSAIGTISDASSPGDYVISTTPDGGVVPVEAVRVKSDKTVVSQYNLLVNSNKYVSYILAQWAVPVGIAASGTIGNNGALTLGTALSIIYSGGVWLFYPANAIQAGSAAGFYWTIMSSTTAGIIYNNTFNGASVPTIIAAPVPFVSVGPGAYVGDTASHTIATITVPGNAIGNNGGLNFYEDYSFTNNGNIKLSTTKLDTVVVLTGAYTGIAQAYNDAIVTNRGISNVQNITGRQWALGGYSVLNSQSSIDTTLNKNITYSLQKITATDNAVMDFAKITLDGGA